MTGARVAVLPAKGEVLSVVTHLPELTRVSFGISLTTRLLSPNTKMHPLARARINRGTRQAVKMAASSQRHAVHLDPVTEPVRLRLTLVRAGHQKRFDRDNLYAALKPVLDGLRDAGWLADDDQRRLPSYEAFQDRGKEPEILVELEWTSPCWPRPRRSSWRGCAAGPTTAGAGTS